MGWSIGFDEKWKRDIGYGVPATCDHPLCGAEINRGLSHVCCGNEPYGGEYGCGLYFCGRHLNYALTEDNQDDNLPARCEQCVKGEPPFTPTPDLHIWVDHKMTDPSWAEWRNENKKAKASVGADASQILQSQTSP